MLQWSVIWANADSLLPPVTSMTSVCPACPSKLDALLSRQPVWPTVTLYILTATLWKLNMLACVCLRACVWLCVYSVHGRCDGRWRVSGCGPARVICLAERWAVNGPAPGSDTCNIVTSELVGCPIWPVGRGHISDILAGAECFTSVM